MREARYAANQASRAATPVPAPPPSSPTTPVVAVKGRTAEEPPVTADAEPQLCGHRNIGNKTCRRPVGHPEKNHRYT